MIVMMMGRGVCEEHSRNRILQAEEGDNGNKGEKKPIQRRE